MEELAASAVAKAIESETLFTKAAEALDKRGIAFLETRASRPESTFRPATRQLVPAIRRAFRCPCSR